MEILIMEKHSDGCLIGAYGLCACVWKERDGILPWEYGGIYKRGWKGD